MSETWDRLLERMEVLRDFATSIKLMEWDQQVMMPSGGAPARARALATLESHVHDLLTQPELGELLEEASGLSTLDDKQRAHVRVLKRDHDRAVKLPRELVRAMAEERGLAYQAWTEARPAADFSRLAEHLKRLMALKKEEADAVGWETERYDALLDEYEPEMRTSDVESMFSELVEGLRPITEAILEAAGPKPDFLSGKFEQDRQKAFSDWLVTKLGFDLGRGRLDLSPHPFTMQISAGDTRQTTRTEPNTVLESIYATAHETGHALYDQGLPQDMVGLPAGNAPSLGMHESQSRLWENQVGRGRPFTDFLLPHLKERFPEALGRLTPEEFHRGVNHVARSLIRVNADEVTYNLHVALRFELEVALLRDELEVDDLPEAWDEAAERILGIRPRNDGEGLLQDMHWSIGAIGYFPTYTLGTLYAAAFHRKAESDLSGLDADLRKGDATRLLGWLRENVHRHAYIYPAMELGERVLGEPLSARPFLDYITEKYSKIFGISG